MPSGGKTQQSEAHLSKIFTSEYVNPCQKSPLIKFIHVFFFCCLFTHNKWFCLALPHCWHCQVLILLWLLLTDRTVVTWSPQHQRHCFTIDLTRIIAGIILDVQENFIFVALQKHMFSRVLLFFLVTLKYSTLIFSLDSTWWTVWECFPRRSFV